MKIELVKNNIDPVDLSVGSARTCYSKTLVTPEKVTNWEKKKSLLVDLFKSGHHTTLQHAHFTFLIEGVSRLSLWRFFHSHRFYNSDQVSQRYTETNKESFKDFKNQEIYNYHTYLSEKYYELTDIFTKIYEESKNPVERKNAKKKAMENARYILPQSVLANLYHTINLSTLLRYHYGVKYVADCQKEVKEIVENMVELVLKEYPDLKELFELNDKSNIRSVYDNRIIKFYNENKLCSLVDFSVFEDEYDLWYGDTAGLGALFNSTIGTTYVKFNLKLSLSADAQNQRHRTAYGTRPELSEIIVRSYHKSINNYYMPDVFKESDKAQEIFQECITKSIDLIDKEDIEDKSYFLLNAFQIPITEVNSGVDFIHKVQKRLCLNSQEEITKVTWCMVNAIKEVSILSNYAEMVAPPCVSRFKQNITPTCPEGSRFCGVKEWHSDKYE